MENLNEKRNNETLKIFEEMPLADLLEFINAAYKRREEMDLSYSLRLEGDLLLAMSVLDKRIGYGIL